MPRVGEIAPDFELLNHNSESVRLSDYRGKRVVLFTFARAGTMGCTKQACALRDAMPKIEAGNNVVILAMSDDSPEALRKWKDDQRLPYDLISDPEGVALDQYGAATASFLTVRLPVRPHTLWVIDENGVVRGAHAPIMLSDAAKTALKDLKAIDEAQTAR